MVPRIWFSVFFCFKNWKTNSSRIETNALLQEEAKKLQSEIKVSMTVAKTLLMRNKWVLKDAIKSSSEIKLADKLCCSARPGECDGITLFVIKNIIWIANRTDKYLSLRIEWRKTSFPILRSRLLYWLLAISRSNQAHGKTWRYLYAPKMSYYSYWNSHLSIGFWTSRKKAWNGYARLLRFIAPETKVLPWSWLRQNNLSTRGSLPQTCNGKYNDKSFKNSEKLISIINEPDFSALVAIIHAVFNVGWSFTFPLIVLL